MKIPLGILFFSCFSLVGQVTLIPDPEFESYLIFEGIDTDGTINGQVWTADIEDETVVDIIMRPMLHDLTGIQDFTSLENLYLFQVDVSELDLSQNLNLKSVDLDDLPLESLDLSNNTELEELHLILNSPSAMFSSDFNSIAVTMLSNLRIFHLAYTKVESVELSNNLMIEQARFRFMPLLEQINLQNGNNENIQVVEVLDNPNVQCIQVDDPLAVMEGNPPYELWFIDMPEALSDDCFVLSTMDELFTQTILFLNPVIDILSIQNQNGLDIESVTLYDTMGRKVLESNEVSGAIEVSYLNSGLYFIHILTDRGILTQKMVKE